MLLHFLRLVNFWRSAVGGCAPDEDRALSLRHIAKGRLFTFWMVSKKLSSGPPKALALRYVCGLSPIRESIVYVEIYLIEKAGT